MRIVLAITLVVVGCWWVALLALLAFYYLSKSSTLRALSRRNCPFCKNAYGMEAACQAEKRYDEECDADVRKILDESPPETHIDVNFPVQWPVVCPHCGHRTVYDSDLFIGTQD